LLGEGGPGTKGGTQADAEGDEDAQLASQRLLLNHRLLLGRQFLVLLRCGRRTRRTRRRRLALELRAEGRILLPVGLEGGGAAEGLEAHCANGLA
jgi:hypothetical protein